MILPEEAYRRGEVSCSEEEAWEIEEAVKEYDGYRAVCLEYLKKMQYYRIAYLICNFIYLGSELIEAINDPKFSIAAVYLLIATALILWRKNLVGAAVSSLMLLALVNEKAAFAIIPVWALFAFNACAAYLHEKKRRYASSKPGYPDFHPIIVKTIKRERPLSQNNSAAELEDISDAKDAQ